MIGAGGRALQLSVAALRLNPAAGTPDQCDLLLSGGQCMRKGRDAKESLAALREGLATLV